MLEKISRHEEFNKKSKVDNDEDVFSDDDSLSESFSNDELSNEANVLLIELSKIRKAEMNKLGGYNNHNFVHHDNNMESGLLVYYIPRNFVDAESVVSNRVQYSTQYDPSSRFMVPNMQPQESSASASTSTSPFFNVSDDKTIVQTTGPKASYTRKTPENRVRKVKPILKNASGQYLVPAKYGTVTIIDCGKIDSTNPVYHTDRYIYPIGFHVTRLYSSMMVISLCYS